MEDIEFKYIWTAFDFNRWKYWNKLTNCILEFAQGIEDVTGGMVKSSLIYVQDIGGWNEYNLMLFPKEKRFLEKSILTFYSSSEYIALKKDSLDSSFCVAKEIDKQRLFKVLSELAASNEVQNTIMRFMSYNG